MIYLFELHCVPIALHQLCRYRHENLLTLMGYSDNGPSRCIVYEFMCNGTLEDWLEGKVSVIYSSRYVASNY